MHFHVRVAAENPVDATLLSIGNCTRGDFRAEPQPSRIDAVQVSRKCLFVAFELLDFVVDELPDAADENITRKGTVELMTMDREMSFSLKLPCIPLIHRYAHEVRHYLRKPLIVVTFYPDDFDFSLRV